MIYGLCFAILVGLLFSFLEIYVIAPLRIRRRNWLSTSPRVEILDAEDPAIPAAARLFLQETSRQFSLLGFRSRGCIRISGMIPRCVLYELSFHDPESGTQGSGMIAFSVVPPQIVACNGVMAFSRRGVDGAEYIVGNGTTPSPWPAPAYRRTWSIPGIAEIGLLYHAFQKQIGRAHV